jgi:hypothetical protein
MSNEHKHRQALTVLLAGRAQPGLRGIRSWGPKGILFPSALLFTGNLWTLVKSSALCRE